MTRNDLSIILRYLERVVPRGAAEEADLAKVIQKVRRSLEKPTDKKG